MGWQLFPTGIGWRSFDRTVEHGSFSCPNGRCSRERDGRQQYVVKSGRNWITILFIPTIPLNATGSYVRCKRCKSFMPVTVLDTRPELPRPAPAPTFAPPATDPQDPVRPEASTSAEVFEYRLVTDWAGTVVLNPGSSAVIGRDPDPWPSDVETTVLVVPSTWLDVSKTHLAVHAGGDVVLVEDRHSTNGTRLHPPGGREVTLVPGDRVPAVDEATIRFGDHAMTVSITSCSDPDRVS